MFSGLGLLVLLVEWRWLVTLEVAMNLSHAHRFAPLFFFVEPNAPLWHSDDELATSRGFVPEQTIAGILLVGAKDLPNPTVTTALVLSGQQEVLFQPDG